VSPRGRHAVARRHSWPPVTARTIRGVADDAAPDAYHLFRTGIELLERGDHHAAVLPLQRVRSLEPEKASVREALGRALFHTGRYGEASAEFEAVTRSEPTNDYALFCLGRCLQQLGRHHEARRPLALAACLRPERADYRLYRDRARAADAA
jgi:Flp pilus assembly protein TadD